MRAAVFEGKGNIRVQDVPMPEVGPYDVLIQVHACGVCGTDVHIYNGDPGASPVVPPRILGHEFAGVITEVGDKVTRFKVGDRVDADPNKWCGSCRYCRQGEAHFCTNMVGYGTSANGGFAELVAVNESQVYKLADDVTFEEGAMGEPVSCCLHGIDMCNIEPGVNAAVIGGGMIGLITLQLAFIAGAAKVAMIEPIEEKRKLAKDLGATICIDPFNENVKEVLEANGLTDLKAVIECVGSPKTMEQAIDIAGRKSVVMLFGLTSPGVPIEVRPYDDLFLKEIELKASYINPYTMGRAVELINTGRIKVGGELQVKPLPLERLVDAITDRDLRAQGKLVINPQLKG